MPRTVVAPKKLRVPVAYVVWFRDPGGKAWARVGWTDTHTTAVALIDGAGDWHLAPIYDPRLVPPTLPLG